MSIKMIDTSEKFMCVVDNRTGEAEYDAYRITIPHYDKFDDYPYIVINDGYSTITVNSTDVLNNLADAVKVSLIKWQDELLRRKTIEDKDEDIDESST